MNQKNLSGWLKCMVLAVGLVMWGCGTDEPASPSKMNGTEDMQTTDDTGRADMGDEPDMADDPDMTDEPTCGNDSIEGGEECDGADLAGATCATEGFDGGDIACASDCTLDTSACFVDTCGDGTVQEGEECDGAELGGATCESEGFDGGDISCASDCTFETSGCFIESCGDGVIQEGEDCDGQELGGATCTDEGFDGGDLACAANCTLDATACYLCGDDLAEGPEVCDGTDLNSETCDSQGFNGGDLACSSTCDSFDTTACFECGDGVVNGTESCDGSDLNGETCITQGFDAGDLSCASTCDFDTSGCVNYPVPAVGDFYITEFMYDPDAIPDATGEWIEFYNNTTTNLALGDCEVRDAGGTYAVPAGTFVAPETYFTIARSQNPGFTPDLGNLNLALGNGGDTIAVWCPDSTGALVEIDSVTYSPGDWPSNPGESVSFDTNLSGAVEVLNNDAQNWCAGQTAYGLGDLGTPGAPNEGCSPPTYTIDFCRLQFPTNIDEVVGSTTTVFGRLFIAGLTDQTTDNDPASSVAGQVGYGPAGTDPDVDPNWVWTDAAPNPGYDGTTSGEPNNDEYMADLVTPSPDDSPYDFAFRFTGDNGGTWQNCDSGGSSASDPYEIAQAGTMTSRLPVLYFSEHIEGSAFNKALEIYNGDSIDLDLSECSIKIYANGSATSTSSFDLDGTLASGEVYTSCHSMFDPVLMAPATCDAQDDLNYNGDDAIELECSGHSLDVIGQIGVQQVWSANGVSTRDDTIRRKCSVSSGDPVGTDPFDPSVEWDSFGNNNVDDFGTYVCP